MSKQSQRGHSAPAGRGSRSADRWVGEPGHPAGSFSLTPPPDLADELEELKRVEERQDLAAWMRARRDQPQSLRRRSMERVREMHRLARARAGRMDL